MAKTDRHLLSPDRLTTAEIGRRHSSPAIVGVGNFLGIPFFKSRRPTIFTIGEGYEFDEEDNDELRRRKESIAYSSNSSLESDAGETWGARSRRRVSIAPVSMGLQSWVQPIADENGRRPSFSATSNKKRKSYDEIKTMVNNGRYNDAKSSVRDGDWDFNHDIRTRLWPFLDTIHQTTSTDVNLICKSATQNGLTDYWETVKELFGDSKSAKDGSSVELKSIGLPAPCPSSSAIYYNLDETGKMVCNRICSIICYTFPDITYCPLLCPLVALFLHYVEEEKAHLCVVNLLSAKNKVFLTQTKVQWDVCSLAALTLTRKYSKSSYAALVKSLPADEKLETIFGEWAWWIFRDLPTQHLVRIMDCFLMEGIKVLYRVTIGILINFAKSKQAGSGNLGTAISEYCKGIEVGAFGFLETIISQIPPMRLLKSSFSIRNFRSSEIRRVMAKEQLGLKGSGGEQNRGHSPYPRGKSGDAMPTSRSQTDLCASSHTLKVPEADLSTSFNPSSFKTSICSREQLLTIWSWLPMRITMYQPELIYTTEEHGSSVTTFFNRVEQYEPTLLIIKTTNDEKFGAYCSTAWAVRNEKDQRGERQRYFGTGETFLFTLTPEIRRYSWVGIKERVEHAKELFMHADAGMLCIGGGEGTGIRIDADLRFGKTERCLTFDNDPLVGHYTKNGDGDENTNHQSRSSGGDFEIQVLEVFGFNVV